MITPAYLDEVVKGTEEACAKLNNELVKRVAKRILDGFGFNKGVVLIPSSIKDVQRMLYNGWLLDDIEEAIAKELPDMEEEVAKAFRESAIEISKGHDALASTVIRAVDEMGVPILPDVPKNEMLGMPRNVKNLNMTAPEIRLLENAYRRTAQTMRNYTKTTAGSANQAFISACDDAYIKMQAGISPNIAITEAISDMGKRGIMTVTYPSGRTDRVEVAIARAVRTGINQANAEIALTRASEMGVKHVKVSAHLGARVTKNLDYTNHSWWQGKVYELDYTKPELARFATLAQEGIQEFSMLERLRNGLKSFFDRFKRKKYDDFVETCGYGKIQGICGINCRHTFAPFIAGVNEDTKPPFTYEESKERYKLTQEQRKMERDMRSTKREIASLEPIKIVPEANARLKTLKAHLMAQDEEYRAFCKMYSLPMQNWRRDIPIIKKTVDKINAIGLKLKQDSNKILIPEEYKNVFKVDSVYNKINDALDKLQSEYNIQIKKQYFEPINNDQSTLFVTNYSPSDNGVVFLVNSNADFLKAEYAMNQRYNKGILAGKSWEDYIAHEMAHAMIYQNCKNISDYYKKYDLVESLYQYLKGISKYADKAPDDNGRSTKGNEAIAEAFVRYRNGELLNPMAEIIVKTMFGGFLK